MSESGIMSYRKTGEYYGINRQKIADEAAKLGLVPKAMSNGKAKGLDRSDRRKIERSLGIKPKARLSAASA